MMCVQGLRFQADACVRSVAAWMTQGSLENVELAFFFELAHITRQMNFRFC